ncbi:MAG: aldo/keto reductase [Clostridia bacterium]|nr:aldo/keto reductase [Clostridia bacterium]
MVINQFFPEIKGNFGFGCMRLPMADGEVDREEFSKMADAFIAAGFNYFDTAHGYLSGKSETAIRDCVSARHDRSEFLLTDKLSGSYFETTEDIRPFILSQLELCGVDYFDFYLMHAQNRENYKKYKETRAYETAYALKEEGLIRHFGLSFHDSPEVLDMILSEHPEVEVVQIQLNYIDWNDATVNSRGVYEVCEKYGKPVIVMEPVKGGSLVNLPEEADSIFRELGGNSNAGYALRFAAGFPNISMVLSGMSSFDQMEDNLSTMRDFRPLDIEESDAVARVCSVFKNLNLIPCTACRYCVDQNTCPMDIRIPLIFAALNSFETFKTWNSKFYYKTVLTKEHGKASDCLKCGMCEEVCPQHLEIRNLLEIAAEKFENK